MKNTTGMKASKLVGISKAGVRHGPSNKNVNAKAKRKPAPSAPTSPLKGPDRGGV